MVRIKDMSDFEQRILGDKLDLSPSVVKSKNGAFVIQLTSNLLESSAHRLNRVIKRHSSNDSETPVYISMNKGTKQQLMVIGKVDLTMMFYKEVTSVLTPFHPEYYRYENKEFKPFSQKELIGTIKVTRSYPSEKFL